MTILLMCAVKDKAVNAFMAPFVARSQGEAMRSFVDACNDVKIPFHAHPEDFALYVVGEWDDYLGKMIELNENLKLAEALDMITPVANVIPIGPNDRVRSHSSS